MNRMDEGLAFLLRFENVAWYEDGEVRILDRRIYPLRTEYVVCKSHTEVAQAIADMVTQSGGPYVAAGMGMALAGYECKDFDTAKKKAFLSDAAYTLSHARPTTVKRMEAVVNGCLAAAEQTVANGGRVDLCIFEHTVESMNLRYAKNDKIAQHLADLFPKKGTIMTQCFGETVVGLMLKQARALGKEIAVICPETRPYFQGARLTASVAQDQGFDVTVITDNMPACMMAANKVDLFTSAADAICMDGHVVNKVGTYQIAIAAKYHGIPYFVTGIPDRGHPLIQTVELEQRDPSFVLQAMGVATAMPGVKGLYPAFDVTPPHLVSGVVTDKGVYCPYQLDHYYADNSAGEYA